jgi:hypothetical protein
MQHLGVIADAHSFLDTELAKLERNSTDEQTRLQAQISRYVGARAFFVIVFAQFEVAMRKAAEQLASARRKSAIWPDYSPWDLIDTEKLPLMDVAALPFPRGHRDYNTVQRYYGYRNRLAHGELIEPEILISAVVLELTALASRFAKP